MTYKPTGRMIQEKPREEKRRVCDQCGEFIDHEAGAIKPHFEVAWRPMLGYDDEGSVSWTADICSVACLQAFAAAGAPRVWSDW